MNLACPARFERATYTLEFLKMRLNNKLKRLYGVEIWCPVGAKISEAGWNAMERGWHLQAVE
jgi:hypothetical protein